MKNGQVLPVIVGGYECIGSPVLIVDPQTAAILDANESACIFYGYSHTDFIQNKILDLAAIPVEEAWQRIQKISSGEITHMSSQHRVNSGEIRDVEVDLRRGTLDNKLVIIATIHDVTERNRAERSLKENEQKYHGFVSQANEAFTLIDEQGVVIEWNPASEQLTGIPASEVLGQFVWDVQLRFISPEHVTTEMRDLIHQRIQAVLETGSGPLLGVYETEIKRTDGKTIIVDQKLFAIKTTKGFQIGAIARDITQEHQTQRELKVSEERYRSLFENMREGFALQEIIQDETGRVVDFRIIDANPAYESHTGQKLEKIIGHTIRETQPNADSDMIERYGKVALTGEPLDFEYYSKTFNRYIRVRSFRPRANQFASIFEDITERKNAEFLLQAVNTELEKRVQERTVELRRSLERLGLATRAANMGIWDWDIQKDELVWDQQMYALYGVKPENFGGAYDAWLNGIHPEDRETSEQVSKLARKGESPYDTEFRVLWPDGSMHWLKADGQVFWEQGEPVRMLGVNYDITERKYLEAELRASEQKYNTLFEKTSVPSLLYRMPEIVIENVNEAFEEFSGYQRWELLGKNVIDIGMAPPAEYAQTVADFNEQGFIAKREARLFTKSGAERTILLNINSVSLHNEPHVITTFTDITERKRLELELSESERKYMALFKKSAVPAVLTKMPEGVFVEVNEEFQGKFGYMNDEIYGKTSVDIGMVKPEERAETYMELERHGFVQNNEKNFLTKTGEKRDCLINVNPVSFNGQDFVITTIADITERKKAETKLIEANIALARALHTKDEFMAAMSHELRTPLNGILGVAELLTLTAGKKLSEKEMTNLAIIEQSGQQLLNLVDDILEFTQLQGGSLQPDIQPLQLAELCTLALQKITPRAAAREQQVHFSMSPEQIETPTDKKLLDKILSLLLDNASKFTSAGGKFGIEVTGRSDAGLVDIVVWDMGIGIAEEDFPRLFKPFTQLDASLARQFEGTGIGLAMVKSMTELLGGTTSFQSTLGKGSRFTVTLPWK